MAELTDEMITELAGWLFTIEFGCFTNSDDIVYISVKGDRRRFVISDIPKWLKSADGLEAVENAMIERGYIRIKVVFNVSYIRPWSAIFSTSGLSYSNEGGFSDGKTKAEAMLLAAYKSMKKEVGNG